MNKIDVKTLNLSDEILDFGDEATIYSIINSKEVYKQWDYKRDGYKKILTKVEKLNALKEVENLSNILILPNNLVTRNNQYSGYTMDYYDGSKLDKYIHYKDAVILLKKLREELIKLHEKGIEYLDLNETNIMYKKENSILDFKLVDPDNIIINNIPMETLPPYMMKYLSKGGKTDYHALFYAINYITVVLLSNFDPRLCKIPNIPNYNRRIEKFAELVDSPKVDSIIDNDFLLDLYDENDTTIKKTL